ncbi:nuclear transport factor 2 family protein [Polaromonas sp. P1-6]|nr:nuclear transport factor 2 family protein [Polaromonas sp. P1-6]
MDDLHNQTIVAACRETVLRAAAAADAGDASALAALFTADAVLERPNAAPIHGRDAIRQAYASRPVERLTRHLVTNTLVDLIAPGEAHVFSLVLVWSGNANDNPGAHGRPADVRQVVGEFRDVLVATNEGWRIARWQAVFVLYTTS